MTRPILKTDSDMPPRVPYIKFLDDLLRDLEIISQHKLKLTQSCTHIS